MERGDETTLFNVGQDRWVPILDPTVIYTLFVVGMPSHPESGLSYGLDVGGVAGMVVNAAATAASAAM